jgi:hypothetical protein
MYESDFDLKYSYCPNNDYNDYNYTVAKTFNLLKNKSAKKVSPLKALPKKANEKPEALVGDVEKKDSSAGKFQSLFKNMKKSPFQSLFKNMKKTEKSSDFASIISSVAHKSLINTQLENEVDQFFLYVDTNKDGYVSPQEVDNFYASMGYELSDEELAYGFLLIDSNGDGLISW